MKQKYVKRQFDEQAAVELANKGFPKSIAEALSSRGVNAGNFDEYFGESSVFHSPFDMVNMRQAVETISYVVECGGSILVYGDYDADGLTASAILTLYFTDNGVDCDAIVPTRDEGYGLHADKVIKAFENKFYDLVITVDCGISNAEEVQKIVDELGVEVIVTDHHELPWQLPDCLCVNPKMGYPFPNLAGAGVAWKLVEALAGREVAARYSELAAIGTIGDIMPMQDENRSIIKLGAVNRNHKSLAKLAELSHCPKDLTASEIAMKITPKINAAGRVGSPETALKMLLARDKADVRTINDLLELNERRKTLLDSMVEEADAMLDGRKIADRKAVVLVSDTWQRGLLGIAASRYKEKYNVPALVMTKDGENYVGSARGVDGADLFDLFSRCSEHLVKFGGHKASVGFSVQCNKLQDFENALYAVLAEYGEEVFEKRFYYDVELGKDCNCSDVMAAAEKLQPLLPQDKFICRVTDSVKFANTFGKDGTHLSVTLASGLEVKGFFKYGKYAPFIRDGANVDIICSLETDVFTHNVCGIIEDITLLNSVCLDGFYKVNLLKNFVFCELKPADFTQIAEILNEKSVAVVFNDYETFLAVSQNLDFSDYGTDIFFNNGFSRKTVVISPIEGYDFSVYDRVIAFSSRGICRNLPSDAICFDVAPARDDLYLLNIDRGVCMKAYSALKHKSPFDSVKGVYDKYLLGKITYHQYVAALRIFEELSFIRIADKYTVEFNTQIKSDLSNSEIFRYFNTTE